MKRTAVLLLFAALFLSACSTTRWVKSPVTTERDYKVSLEYRIKGGQVLPQHYDHPCKLDQRVVATFLKGLDYENGGFLFGKEKKWPIFQASEIDRLAPAISKALAHADTNQRVAFTSFNRGGEFIFKHRRITSGILFVKPENRLNIAFTFINYDLNPNRDYEVPQDLAGRNPLTIRLSTTPSKATPTAPYAKSHVFANGDKSPVWIVANISELKAAEKSGAGQSAVNSQNAPAASGKAVSAPAQETPVETMEMRQKRLEKKLEFLKGLYDKGLINQKEYDRKKSDVLNELK